VKPRSRKADAQAIAHHYDVSNEFYELFLDPLMVYTCAYYRDPDGKLEQAQQDKLDLVCRKLELRPGETLLDIGCGWGSLAIWAAQHYGVRAHGVTLSRAQADYAAERIRREGLEGRCRVEYLDYRDLPRNGSYDKIAAVGVIEHVGIPHYPAFFGGVRAIMKDGGLYLNHGIVHEFHWKPTSQTKFLYRHVFPNGDLAGLSETLTEMERAGLEIVDVEGLRLHYARTCRQWVERLRERADEARALAGERAYRTWLLYLTCSAVAFENGSIGLYQVLMRKHRDPRAGGRAPRTREHLYERTPR
jgi:cyclopropane-fatty-acyl-phospholipid synthase